MRIIAIRGKNLASLAGDFAIDFTAEPLAGSGIFAITGPTGAGKSTLLDAICLALFNEIPRLRAAPGRGQLGEGDDNTIAPGDTRAILRHGTADAYAEVDFAMPGGASYRARWAVRRARGKPDGKLQNNEHSFIRLDTSERLGGTRGETKTAIRDVIGLSAEQFGRAVLLAQGDFEAFIRADANDRAQLLERLTGSEIYTTLGKRAFEKARTLRDGLDALARQIADLNGLDDNQRKAAEAALAGALATQTDAQARLEDLQTARRWEVRAHDLAGAVDNARNVHSAAQALSTQAEPRRQALARDRRALALATDWAELEKAAARQGQTRSDVERISGQLDQAIADELSAEAAEAAAQAGGVAAEADGDALAPAISAARELDVRLAEAAQTLAEAGDECAQELARETTAAEADLDASRAYTEAQHAHGDARDWLEAHVPLERLAQREDDLAQALADHARLANALATRRAERPDYETALTVAHNAHVSAERALVDTADKWQAAQAVRANAEEALPTPQALASLTERRDSLGQIDTLLALNLAAHEAQATAERSLHAVNTSIDREQIRQAPLAERQAELESKRPALAEQIADAERALQLLRSAASDTAEALRATLQPGEPCPVCGADEHRLGLFEGKLGEHLRAREQSAKALDDELEAIDREIMECTAQSRALTDTLVRLHRDQLEQAKLLDPIVSRAKNARKTLGLQAAALGLPEDPEALPEALRAQRREADEALAAIAAARTAADEGRNVEQLARANHDKAQERLAAARAVLTNATQTMDQIDRDLAADQAEAERIGAMLDRNLGPAGDWRLLPDAAGWLADQANAWRDYQAQVERLSSALAGLQAAHITATSNLHNIRQNLARFVDKRDKAIQAHSNLVTTRAGLLNGEAVSSVEQRLAHALQSAIERQQAAAQERERKSQMRAALAAGATAAVKAAQEAQDHHAARVAAFAQALEMAGLEAPDVARVAQLGEAVLAAEARTLADLEGAVAIAQAQLVQREGDLAHHQTSFIPEVLGEPLLAAVQTAAGALEAATQARADAEFVLRQDDAVRTRTAQLRAELERQNQGAAVWLALADLIGDATGAKFRRFAQGLTLDRLLDHANIRLAELKPRYTLERAAGGDMLIQVIDNDMGGEVRGLQNLSGGERFLVSLALALGLAEMSTAGGVKIESLFIDEGFGALDPASLGQAVALLEHLHATGRRVGVISHIEELKERIPVKIEVTPTGRGTSRIEVIAG